LGQKEDLEEQMASCAAIHYIYKKFKEIQEEIKFSVKEYNR